MKTIAKNTLALVKAIIAMTLCLGLLSGCGSDSKSSTTSTTTTQPDPEPQVTDPQEPDFSAMLFNSDSASVTNQYFPLKPGVSLIYEGFNDEGETERLEITVSHETRMVDGVESAIVVDRVYVDDELEEETFDWFAQDIEGNVWYMGEDSVEIEDGEIVSHEGSWESGMDIDGIGSNAIAGIQMKATLVEGDSYLQEYYQGVAEDMAQIDTLAVDVALANGDSYSAIKILEWNPLEPDDVREFKYFAPGIGMIKEEKEDMSETVELIEMMDQASPDIDIEDFSNSTTIDHPYFPATVGSILTYQVETEDGLEEIVVEVTAETRNVMGIECVVIRDTVTLDGVLVEDTYDWFAQDNDGNVWYMGEDVDNYNYDDEGEFIEIDHEGAWEAGVDDAQPGIQMPAMLRVGDSYRQEYLAGEAEDLAAIKHLALDITLENGDSYTTLQVKEWNPLEEDSLEYKYYAQGIGLVREEDAEGEEVVELISIQP